MTTPAPTDATLGPEVRIVVDGELARLSTPDHALIVLDGVRRHGAGFAAWLRVRDTPPEDPTCLLRFEQHYAGQWETIDDLIVDTVEALAWREDLDELRLRNHIPANYLIWDRNALIGRIHATHSLVELDGLTYAFTR